MTDWLLGTLLATSGLIVLVLFLREPVRRQFGARVAYGLWLIPAARLLMPTLTDTVERVIPARSPLEPMVRPVVDEPVLLTNVVSPGSTLLDQLGGWQTILVVLWLGIAGGLFVAHVGRFRRERSALLRGSVELGRLGSIRLVRSPVVKGPLAFGIVDRVIAVPTDFEQLYSQHERRLALEHELAHHRSGDLVANFIAFVLLCLQWFNPLAWAAHAAFRFDQEAACDARVLDKAKADDRADYGRTIAKAASGRALLFASALGRRNILKRRLKSMLSTPTAGRRLAGRLLVLSAIAVALPLTASRAIDYVDIPAPVAPATPEVVAAPAASVTAAAAMPATVAAVATVASVQAPVPVAPAAPSSGRSIRIDDGTIWIDGERKKWSDLSPAERQEIRSSIASARESLARNRVDREQMRREIAEATAHIRINGEEMRRNLAEARSGIAQALASIDAHKVEIRRSGQDPERIKVQVRESLKAIEKVDVEAISRNIVIDREQIASSIAAAERAVAEAEAELDRLDSLGTED